MKNLLLAISTISFLAVFALQGCDRPAQETDIESDATVETDRDLDRTDRDRVVVEVEDIRTDAEIQIAENNRLIEQHRERIRTEDLEDREEQEERLNELEQRNQDMERRLHEYEATDDDDWEEFQDDFNSSIEDLRNSLRDLFNL
ncbi:hypothetical protein BH23BAC3_BH23BAC3_19610 [soil metagenome]